jgi:hypothetical protein
MAMGPKWAQAEKQPALGPPVRPPALLSKGSVRPPAGSAEKPSRPDDGSPSSGDARRPHLHDAPHGEPTCAPIVKIALPVL